MELLDSLSKGEADCGIRGGRLNRAGSQHARLCRESGILQPRSQPHIDRLPQLTAQNLRVGRVLIQYVRQGVLRRNGPEWLLSLQPSRREEIVW